MMLLIAMAITVAFAASWVTSLGLGGFDLDFWWELALLVAIMLLGHWIEMRALGSAQGALDALAARPGYVGGLLGRNLDDPGLWLLTTTWADVGSYRRALSAYDVKVAAVPLLSRAVDEPSAYEGVEPGGTTNQQQVRTVN